MVARPIGIHHLKPVQKNRAFEILVEKFLCDGGRKNTGKNYLEHGLNIYPKTWHNQTSSKNQI